VALNSRVIIEQPKGIFAERLRVTPDQAFIMLRPIRGTIITR
jgi:hypothetical protein